MATSNEIQPVACGECPLEKCRGLRAPSPQEREWIAAFKVGEAAFVRGEQVLAQGARTTQLYTVLEGVLIRYRAMEDGGRQIINFVFPGDFIGLQAALDAELSHAVETLTNARLCVFQRDRFFELAAAHPRLSFDVTWLAAREEAALEEHLVSLGQRNARERMTYLAVFLVERGIDTGIAVGNTLSLTVTQSQIADMLGLSLVHTNRTLQALRRSGLVLWSASEITVPDLEAARRYARMELELTVRPFL